MNNKIKLLFLVLLTYNTYSIGQNVGIGISNPQQKLHIDGNLFAEKGIVSSGLYHVSPNNEKYLILKYNVATNKINIGNHMEISSNGKVGINPISSAHKLSISNSFLSDEDIIIDQVLGGQSFERTLFTINSPELEFMDQWLVIDQSKRAKIGSQYGASIVTVKEDVIFEDKMSMASDLKFKEIRKHTVNVNIPNIPSGTSIFYDFIIPGAEVEDMVVMTVTYDIPGSLIHGQAYVAANNVVRVKFTNEGSNNQNPSAHDYHFMMIKK